jgi:hypothetical protein
MVKDQNKLLRQFGYLFTAIFLIIGSWPLIYQHDPRYWCYLIALLFLLIAFIRPEILEPFYKLWMRLGDFLGRIVTPVVMLLIFICAFIPTALCLRLLGKDSLRLKFDPHSSSYWIHRDSTKDPMGSMKNQF